MSHIYHKHTAWMFPVGGTGADIAADAYFVTVLKPVKLIQQRPSLRVFSS